MKITFLGASRTVTGSFFVVETGMSRFAVDCGLFQGPNEIKERNYQPFRLDPSSIDFLILTHAHIDHIGLVPKLCAQGFKGPIYCTAATTDLAHILLPDSAHVQEMEIERKNRKLIRAGKPPLDPIYSVEQALECLSQFKSMNYDELNNPASDIEFRIRDAGHILGSGILEIWIKENDGTTKLVFSGDLGNFNQRIVKDPTFIESADYLFLESTYGDRLHQANLHRMEQLLDTINYTMQKGGNLIIPSFAVERTQDILYDLNILYRDKKLPPDVSVYIDSPLAIAATEIFRHNVDYYDNETRELLREGMDPFGLPILQFSKTKEESMELNEIQGRAIIISASGMCDAGRVKHHLKHNLWRPESTVLFVGYQAAATLGRRLLEGEKLVTIHGESVVVKADIRQLDSYSAHADQAGIMSWLKRFNTLPRTIFLVHGEEQVQKVLAELIEQELQTHVIVPAWLDEIELGVPSETRTVSDVPEAKALRSKDEALQAEEAYYDFRLLSNRFFQENWEAGKYDKIIRLISEARKLMDGSK
ncbi:MAG: MBL fold metallo-hydrolase RNA specificity domain-containing protein [Acidobacteriota bacterium]